MQKLAIRCYVCPVNDLSTRRDRLVYRWDLDKTYLRTEFDSLRDLVKTAFEPPDRKRTVPGAAVLLREIRAMDPAGIFILSGSPEQMRRVLEAKLRLDGVRWDALTLKPSLRNVMRGRFRFLRDQVSYKLSALMRSRMSVDPESDEILFGDDAEADAFIYSLYADLAAGRVTQEVLMGVLESARVYPEDVPQIVRIAVRLPRRDMVQRIFIHLERVSSTAGFVEYGNRVCAFYNYFQPALVLLEDQAIDVDGVFRVGADLLIEHGFNPDVLTASFQDLIRRGYLSQKVAEAITNRADDILASNYGRAAGVLKAFVREVEARWAELPPTVKVEVPEIDYVALFPKDRERAHAMKRRVMWRRGDR